MAKGPYTLSNGVRYVIVEKGDTLTQIAVDYLKGYNKYKTLASINKLSDANKIVVGQHIYLDAQSYAMSNTSSYNAVKFMQFGLQSNTERTLYACWDFSKEKNTKEYKIVWYYTTGDGVSFVGSETSNPVDDDNRSASRQCTYTIPDNAIRVWMKVKPISKDKDDNGGVYFTASWANSTTYHTSSLPLSTPSSAPSVKIDGLKLTASLDNIDIDGATHIQFRIYKNNASEHIGSKQVEIVSAHASHQFSLSAGSEYKVRYRAYRKKDKTYSDWSPYSDNYKTRPATPDRISDIHATSETSVYLEWGVSKTATGYEIQYTTESRYFDTTSEVKSITGIENNYWEVTGLTTGKEYYFRVRAVDTDSNDESGWTEIKSVVVGSTPSAPTTWSSTTTAITGELVNLYWVHNSEDGSSQTYADLELYVNGSKDPLTYLLGNKSRDDSTLTYAPLTQEERDEGKTNSVSLKTTSYTEGSKIEWRVRTAGITNTAGEWSVKRMIDINAPATLELRIKDKDGNETSTIQGFPFHIDALPGPNTQAPLAYHLTVVSKDHYETIDAVGNPKVVNDGDLVFSKHYDAKNSALSVDLSAGDLDLENGYTYTVTCTVSMNTGLTAEETADITVDWVTTYYSPNAEIRFDNESMTATIRPYCENRKTVYYQVNYENNEYVRSQNAFDYVYSEDEIEIGTTTDGYSVYSGTSPLGDDIYYCIVDEVEEVAGATMAVYRREFDGTLIEIGNGLEVEKYTWVTDPHPSLDYARYRIVATDNATGAVSYYDMPGYPVGGTAVIIQWDEDWINFETNIDAELARPAWSGSMLTLPYNIDVSDSNSRDISLVEYIGRENPVSYYGTQQGYQSTWNVEIAKSDKETLYALRRLQRWMGDVYVREPSGSGYWASVSVSFNQKHTELTIPVTLNINRVEGGV